MSSGPIRVLLVEDNPGDARLLREFLKEPQGTPFELVHVDRLSEALTRLGEERFGMILLDLSLPDSQGIETITRVHSHAAGTPIVVLTGLDDEEVAVKALQQGAQDYLVKGQIDGHLLVRSLRYAIQRQKIEEVLKSRNKELLILREISETILSSLDLRSVLESVLEKAISSGSFDLGNIRLLDSSGDTLEVAVVRGYRDPKNVLSHRSISRTTKTPQSRFGDRLLKHPCIEEHVQACNGLRTLKKEGVESFIEVPVRAENEVLGIIQLASRAQRKFRPEEVNLLATIGNQMGVAVQRTQLYEQTKKQAADLTKANKGKDEFLSVMSHELRTPLNVIMGYTSMIREKMFGEVTPEQAQALEKVACSSMDLLAMVDGILQATQIEAQAIEVRTSEVNLSHFMDDLKAAYEILSTQDHAFNWHYPADLPTVNTDAPKLKQILRNLINNAVKFGGDGAISVSAHVTPGAGIVKFRVSDTGIGIAKDNLARIFEMFQQIDSSETRLYGGVGLGLYIVKRFTEMLGGAVDVESELGNGSTFVVTIPYEDRGLPNSHLEFAPPGINYE